MSLEHAPQCATYSVATFCKAHNISRALFYSALKEGWGPRIMKCGRRTIISVESAADWRRKMEAATDAS